MLIHKYLYIVFCFVAFDSIVLTVAYSAFLDSSLVPFFAGARMLVDILFIFFAFNYIKLSKIEVSLIMMIFISCVFGTILGIGNSSAYLASRFFNDISGPLIFILKVSALRLLFGIYPNSINLKKLTKYLIILSVLQVLIFLFLSYKSGAYAGITPPVNIPAAIYIGGFNFFGLASVVTLILLSGKRSFLVSVVVISLLTIIAKGGKRIKIYMLFITITFILLLFFVGNEKLNYTFFVLNDLFAMVEVVGFDLESNEMRSGLYLLTGGRSEEFYGILREMSPWSWLVGLGPGFTYSFLYEGDLIEEYANAHFSPLSLAYKFGLLFTFLFYIYIAGVIVRLMSISGAFAIFVSCAILIFSIQSLFAFNLFVEPYYPVFLALGMAFVKSNQVKSHSMAVSVRKDLHNPAKARVDA